MAPYFIVKYLQAEGVLRWIQRLVYDNLITVSPQGLRVRIPSPAPIKIIPFDFLQKFCYNICKIKKGGINYV